MYVIVYTNNACSVVCVKVTFFLKFALSMDNTIKMLIYLALAYMLASVMSKMFKSSSYFSKCYLV
jgi:hypothetical protein